ncbi:MAG: hypothetical protein NC184_07045 [Roseburia sp.]|nr:hypothetical protein [Roseburia sp.]
MSKPVLNALKATAVLICITVVCVAVLALCNMYFPKYVPKLDSATASSINAICPTGMDDAAAFDDGYIVMLYEDDYGVSLDDYNKANKSKKAEILAVYGEPKGEHAGAYIIEAKSEGRDGDVVILTAYVEGTIVGATVKKQGESYWSKLPENLFDTVVGKSGDVDLVGEIGKTGATLSLTAVDRALDLSGAFALDHSTAIRKALSEKAVAGGGDND